MPDYDHKFIGRDSDGAPLQIGVRDGKIIDVGASIPGEGSSVTDFGESIMLPGWIDAHVHFNEPGRTDWEGISSGSRALAAGGGTVFFDMPLNSSPPVITAEALLQKRALAEKKSWTDFALWGGLTPDSLQHLSSMADAGAVGFKAFLCPSGLDEYPAANRQVLMDGAKIAADLGLPIAVHAEVGEPFRPDGSGTDYAAWCASRPISMELAGIELALEASSASGAAFHIVHVSSAAGIDLIQEAKAKGINVSAETCPHYLLLDEVIGARIGATAKCAPPLRPPAEVAALWERVRNGMIDTIGSDHSPCPPDMKENSDLFQVWGGIAGIQHALPLLLGKDIQLQRLCSQPIAKRFSLTSKGGLRVGVDADFMIVQRGSFPVKEDASLTRHSHSPYTGLTAKLRVKSTYLRGEPITGPGRAHFLRPHHS
jgi:allantoinase